MQFQKQRILLVLSNESKIIKSLNKRVIGNNGRPVKKLNEYVWWSPFVHHHKPKLQVNLQTQKWHCWVSESGGHNFFQLFKKIKASQKHFDELRDISGDTYYGNVEKKEIEQSLSLPKEFIPLWNGADRSPEYKNAMRYLQKRDITRTEILKYGIGYYEI